MYEQMQICKTLSFEGITFTFPQTKTRESMTFRSEGRLTCHQGETVLVKGQSGAGKSTLYDILNGTILKENIGDCNVWLDGKLAYDGFHNLEERRTMVLQDTIVRTNSTCYEIVTDMPDPILSPDCVSDSAIWQFLQLVMLDDVFREQFKGNLHCKIKDKLSGGQKMRLVLARALFRASEYSRNSKILILDEPDKGLPADTTVQIIKNIIDWCNNKILFLTLHTKEAQEIGFTHVIQVEDGIFKLK